MDRRTFLKYGSLGLGGVGLTGTSLSALVQEAIASSVAAGTPWKFGVMADTQWSNKTTDPANPASCAINIISALNRQFIDHGVKFVVQVGDLVDVESWDCPASYTSDPFGNAGKNSVRTLPYRAWAAQSLYDAGIGFFPLRGNHDGSSTAANEILTLFPQMTGGGDHIFGVSNIIPSSIPGLVGLSYAFDIENIRIVLIDQFTRKDGTGSTNNNVVDQITWVDKTLADRPNDSHAFVMAHKNLIGQNHADCLFGSSATSNPDGRNAFIASLQANKVGYYIGGHDHMHHRSIIASPDGTAKTEQIICSSNSYKFYNPKNSKSDTTGRESVLAHELFTIGYYIFTIEGPCVTVDFYSSSHAADYGDIDLLLSPASYAFHRRERFGYSLNGKQFVIANNDSYTSMQDTYNGTTAKILAGTNEDTATDSDFYGREEVKTVKTGWKDMPAGTASAVLKLWGLDNNLDLWDAGQTGQLPNGDADYVTDTYVLSLSYVSRLIRPSPLGTGFCLAAKDADGNWVNAVDLNEGGSRKFVLGGWNSSYGLGTYGVDPSTHTVWAVLNRDGEFVACAI